MRKPTIVGIAALLAASTTPVAAAELKIDQPITVAEAGRIFGADSPAVVWAGEAGAKCFMSEVVALTPVAKGIWKALQCFEPGYTGDKPSLEDYSDAVFIKIN